MAYTTIKKPSDYFNTKLYTGNGVGGTNITGVGFQPDLVWIKRRSGVENHVWNDVVRGVPNNIYSSSTNAQDSGSLMSAILSDGFTVQTDASVNSNNDTYAAWNWLAGGGQGSSNTDGSINTTYTSVNTTAGFSISKYTGTGSAGTIGHGLGAEPHVVIVKKLNSAEQWFSYHKPLGNTGALVLNTTAAKINDAGYWNSTTPTSSVFSVTSNGSNNASGDTYIAYCFAPKTGYSKFGSYTGNGNADGTFVYTGFKPAFVILKRTNGGTNDWVLYDTKRCINGIENALEPNTSNSEATVIAKTDYNIDLLSNGFKPRSNSDQLNGSADTYIYMAFAEEPLVGDNPCTAR